MGDSANSSRSKTVVIGAGSAGLACATKLVDLGRDVTVVEASPFVGGLARSLELWGQIVDLGPHRFFSHDRVVINFWSRFVGSEFTRVNRLTRIAYQGTFFLYPLDAADALRKLSPIDTAHALASYAKARARPIAEPRSFEDWVTNRFGGHLFRMFFKTYSEKVWGISCQELDADWAAQRIKKLSLFEAAKAAVFKDRGRTHKTLADEFKYPRGGSGVIYERMRQHIEAKGGSVRLSAPVKRVLVENGRAKGVELESGEVRTADHVVVATTAGRAAALLPGDWRDERAFLEGIVTPPFVFPTFFLDRPLEKGVWSWVSQMGKGGRVSIMIDALRKSPLTVTSGKSVLLAWPCYPASADLVGLSDDEVVDACRRELDEYFPGFSSWIEETHVTRHAHAVPFHPVGHQGRALRFLAQTDRRGVSFAGDYLSGGYLEPALWSAERAAAIHG